MIKMNKLLLCLKTEFWLNIGDDQNSTMLLHHSHPPCVSLSTSLQPDLVTVIYLSFCDRSLLSYFFLLFCDRPL